MIDLKSPRKEEGWRCNTIRHFLYLIILCAVLAVVGCTGKQTDVGEAEMSEVVWTARHNLNVGLEYDNQQHQIGLAELHYKKSFETLKDEPSQAWDIYAEAGYRYACMLYQLGDMEGVMSVVDDVLKKAEGNKDFPAAFEAGLLSLMAQCQLRLAMPEEAKQTFVKAYEHQLNVLGGREKGDFNLAIMCSDIFLSFFKMGEYDEAGKWLNRYEEEFRTCERIGVGDSLIISEHNGLLALYKAQYLHATGRERDAAAVYAAIPRSQLVNPSCIEGATDYLMAAGRYAEAADMYNRLDTAFAAVDSSHTTVDKITLGLVPRYVAYRRAGRIAEALQVADKTNAAIDSAITRLKQKNAAELAVIYLIHEKDMQLASQQFSISLHRLFAVVLVIILLLIAWLLWRSHIYNKVLTEKNRRLLDEIEKQERKEQQAIEQLNAEPEEGLTASQQLYRRLCTIMSEQQPYTNEALNRDTLAQLLGTNAKYVEQAIRECSDGETVGDFITRHRLERVTHLLKATDNPIGLIGELSGIPNRATLARLFRNAYGMTCSEYRQAVKSKATEETTFSK